MTEGAGAKVQHKMLCRQLPPAGWAGHEQLWGSSPCRHPGIARWNAHPPYRDELQFFPRVRTPCGHGAQVIVEGREEKTDGGERNEGPKTNPNQTPKPAGRNSTIL